MVSLSKGKEFGLKQLLEADQTLPPKGYKLDGPSITKEEMVARANRSGKDISEGRIKTSEQIREEMKNW